MKLSNNMFFYRLLNWVKASFYAHITIYYRSFLFSKKVDIRDADETLDMVIKHKVSVSRFGDGEVLVINGDGNGFQDPNPVLSQRLREILASDMQQHLVCMPYGWKNKKGLRKKNRLLWTWHIARYGALILSIIRKGKTYYNTNYTRYYMDADPKIKHSLIMDRYYLKFKKQWDNRDVCIVEGDSTRFGIGNDLLHNAHSIRRIVCPARNAFDVYDTILESVKKNIDKKTLILCSLGMTATVLAYDLAKDGYQAIDIGHADIDYEWYKLGVNQKVLIPGKAVNELGVQEVAESNDTDYHAQIIDVIKKK